jgi:hypothetical protein
MKINHEANFMNALVETKEKIGMDTTLFEWDTEIGAWKSAVVRAAWYGYVMAVYDTTGEILE